MSYTIQSILKPLQLRETFGMGFFLRGFGRGWKDLATRKWSTYYGDQDRD